MEILRILGEFGTEVIIYSRLNKRENISAIVKNLIEVRLLFSVIILLIFSLVAKKFEFSEISFIFLLLPILSIQSSSFVFIQKENSTKKTSIIGIISLISIATIYLTMLNKNLSIKQLASIMLIPDFIVAITSLYLTKKYWLTLNLNFFRILRATNKLLKFIVFSGGIGLAIMIYSRLDIVLVRPLLGFESQAIYSYAFRFIEPISICFTLLALSFLAEIGKLNNNLIDLKFTNFIKSFSAKKFMLLFVLNMVLASLLVTFSETVINFKNHRFLIFALSMNIFIKFINTILSTYFYRKSFYAHLFQISIINLFVVITVGLILGYYFGISGIAVASIVGEITNYFLQRKKILSVI
jgi:hypothetical protein